MTPQQLILLEQWLDDREIRARIKHAHASPEVTNAIRLKEAETRKAFFDSFEVRREYTLVYGPTPAFRLKVTAKSPEEAIQFAQKAGALGTPYSVHDTEGTTWI